MTTTDTETCALLSQAAYFASNKNTIILPEGWEKLDALSVEEADGWLFDPSSEFRGLTYLNESSDGSKNIVIAFAGTDQIVDHFDTNAPLYLGNGDHQLDNAVKLYLDVKAAYPDANITFTGHSLGGGLASILGALFDEPTTVFNPAPFEAVMTNQATIDALNANGHPAYDAYLENLQSAKADYVEYLDQHAGGSLTNFHLTFEEYYRGSQCFDLFLDRESRVESYITKGDVLSIFRSHNSVIEGEDTTTFDPNGGVNNLSMTELHKITLQGANLI